MTIEEASQIILPKDVIVQLHELELRFYINYNKLEEAFMKFITTDVVDNYMKYSNNDQLCRVVVKLFTSNIENKMINSNYHGCRFNADIVRLYIGIKKVVIDKDGSVWRFFIANQSIEIPIDQLDDQKRFRVEYLKKFDFPAAIMNKVQWTYFLRAVSVLKRSDE